MAYVDSLNYNLLREFISVTVLLERDSSQLMVEMLGKRLIYSG